MTCIFQHSVCICVEHQKLLLLAVCEACSTHRSECGSVRWLSSAAASARLGRAAWTRTPELPGASALSSSLSLVASGSGLEMRKRDGLMLWRMLANAVC